MDTTCDVCGGPVAIVKCKYICTQCGTINKSCADLARDDQPRSES